MKKLMTWAAVFVLVVGGGILTFWPVDHWRLYDANQQPLALTERENYCAGFTGITVNFQPNHPSTLKCLEENSRDNTVPSISKSPGWACTGIIEGGWGGSHEQCATIIEANQLWLLATGGLTMEWNEAHPRPKPIDEGVIADTEPTRENRSSDVAPNYVGDDTDE